MPEPRFPEVSTTKGLEYGVRTRFQTEDFILYRVTGEDVKKWAKLPLFAIANDLLDDTSYWWILADVNTLTLPWSYAVEDIIAIPRDFANAEIISLVDDQRG